MPNSKSHLGNPVKLGIAKCKLEDSSFSSNCERVLAKRLRSRRTHLSAARLHDSLDVYSKATSACTSREQLCWINSESVTNSKINSQLYFSEAGSPATPKSQSTMYTWSPCSSRSISPCGSSVLHTEPRSRDIVHLPQTLERHININKGAQGLGLVVDAECDKGVNGCVVKSTCSKKSLARDGRVQPGDFIVKVNNESLRNVTTAKAKAILKRANLLGTICRISYITSTDALLWRQQFQQNSARAHSDDSFLTRLSPKIFPKFYRPSLCSMEKVEENRAEKGNESKAGSPIDVLGRFKIEAFVEHLLKSAFVDALIDLLPLIWHTAHRSNKSKRPSLDIGTFYASNKSRRSMLDTGLTARRVRANSLTPQTETFCQINSPPLRKKFFSRQSHLQLLEEATVSTSESHSIIKSILETVSPLSTLSHQNDDVVAESVKSIISNALWTKPRTVVLERKPDETFGISIVGGRVEVDQQTDVESVSGNLVSGIFIKSVLRFSPAAKSGQVFMGDRVLSVNNIDLQNVTHDYAVQVIKNAENPVVFGLQSLQGFYSRALDRSGFSSVVDDEDMNFGEENMFARKEEMNKSVEENIKHRLYPNSTVEFDSAAALEKLSNDDEEEDSFFYTQNKIRRKYANLPGEPILIRLENVPPGGLGLSIAASQAEDGNAEKKSMVVVDIKSTSQADLKVGDELLEINSKVLTGVSHVTASEKIYSCRNDRELVLVILRKEGVSATSSKFDQLDFVKEYESGNAPTASFQNFTSPKEISTDEDVPHCNSSNGQSSQNTNEALPNTKHSTSSLFLEAKTNGRKRSWAMDILQKVSIECGKETLIEIDKDGRGLGLSIVGGSDTVLGSVMIHEVYPDGAAAIDGRLKPGDQVLDVNGIDLRNVAHEVAISSLRRTPAKVRLLIYRSVDQNATFLDPAQLYDTIDVELTKKPGRGLGLSIVGRKNEPGVYISELIDAFNCKGLMQGDHILAVNGINVSKSMQEDVAAMLKTTTGKVVLKIGRWKLLEAAQRIKMAHPSSNNNGNISSQFQQPQLPLNQQQNTEENNNDITSRILVQQDQQLSASLFATNGTFSKTSPPPPAPYASTSSGWTPPPMFQITVHDENNQQVRSDLSPVSEEDLKSISETDDVAKRALVRPFVSETSSSNTPEATTLREDLNESGSDSLLVFLKKEDGQQWGMGIGKRPRGILITSLQPGSSAAEKLLVGDRILAVNGNEVTDQHSAVLLVKTSGNKVALQIARPQKGIQISFK